MKLSVEIWKVSETQRHYLTNDLLLTSGASSVSWFKEKMPEALELSEREEDLAMGIFAISAITSAAIWPRGLEIDVEDPKNWEEVEPGILNLLQSHTGAEDVTTFDSPQNLS
jgi:hypothetical protein